MSCSATTSYNGWQGVKIMTDEEIEDQANKCLLMASGPCPSTWLSKQQSQSDKIRLTAVGNVVIPKCAALAMHILARALPQTLHPES